MNSNATPPDSGREGRSGSFSEWYRTWRYFFWVIGVGVLVVVFYGEENWRGEWAWRRYRRQMELKGERFERSAFIPPAVVEEENFAMTPVLAPLFDFIPGTQRWRNTNAVGLTQTFLAKYDAAASMIRSKKAIRLNSWTRERTDLSEWQSAFIQLTNGAASHHDLVIQTNLNPQEAAAGVLAALAESDPDVEEIRAASRLKYCRFNIHYQEENPAGILLPHLAVLKHISQVLQLRATAELELGQTEAAYQDVNLMLFLADASRDEPILISQLVRFSLFQLALQPIAEGFGKWSDPQLRELEQRLQGFDFCAQVKQALRAERVLFSGGIIEYIRHSPNKLSVLGELQMAGGGNGDPAGNPLACVVLAGAPDGWLYLEQLSQDRIFDADLLPTIDLTRREIRPPNIRRARAHLAADINHSPLELVLRHRFFAALLLPSISSVVQKTAFAQTGADIATIACALERYRLAHGQYPEAIEALAPDLISTLPHDIIDGQPLKYRRTDDGQYHLYSVGWNEKDDGGVVKMSTNGDGNNFLDGDWVWKGLAQ